VNETLSSWQVASAVVRGREHERLGLACQDAAAWVRGPGFLVATVCDGCGSGGRSEVGAALAARLFTAAVARARGRGAGADAAWRVGVAAVTRHLRVLAAAMGADRREVVVDHFLFTIVSAVVTGETIAVFALGDGVIAVGERVVRLGPFADDQPPYLGYRLLGLPVEPTYEASFPAAGVDTVMVASDGLADYADLDPDGLAPLSAPAHFRNPDALRRHLALAARTDTCIDWDRQRIDRVPGRLGDDTAVVVVKRSAA
jgi:hypothetical protein